jgi:hypothetical protein
MDVLAAACACDLQINCMIALQRLVFLLSAGCCCCCCLCGTTGAPAGILLLPDTLSTLAGVAVLCTAWIAPRLLTRRQMSQC